MKRNLARTGLLCVLFVAAASCGSESAPGDNDAGDAPSADAGSDEFLPAPPDGEGFQVVVDPFEVAPGTEVYYCYRLPLPATADFDLQRLEGRFSLGAHHMLISTIEQDYEPGQGPCSANDFGFEVDLTAAFQNNLRFLSGAQTPYFADPRTNLEIEDGMAFRVKANTTLLLQLHWANTTDEVQNAQTALNFWYSTTPPAKYLDSFFFYHTAIALPPQQQTEVAGRCVFPESMEVVGMVSHMHARGTHFETHAFDGVRGDLVYEENTWQEPEMKMWPMSGLYQVEPQQGFEYRCFFDNDTNEWIYEGDGAGEEMCMMIGLYTGGDGTIWGFPGTGFPGNVCVDIP